MRFLKSGFALLALMLAVTGATTWQASAQESTPESSGAGTIEVHARLCDEVPADWFEECHESASPDTFIVAVNEETSMAVEGTTDANGNVVLEVEPGTWTISGPPADTLQDWFVYCSTSDAPGDDIGHPVTVGAGANVVCDFFFVPADLSGQVDVVANVNLCIAPGCTELPEAIEPADGVSVELSDVNTGEALGECSSAGGQCVIEDVPAVPSVSVMVDPNTMPDGYMLDPNPANYEIAPEAPELWILLYPIEGFPPEGTPEAPEVPDLPLAMELPASVYTGTCADLEMATSAEPLNDLTMVDAEHGGSADALVAASGYTRMPMTVDEFMAGEYAIAVLDEGQEVIACGDVGGVIDEAGAVAIGLAPVDDSGAAGIAYIAPRGEGETGISVFLVPEGLIPTVVPEIGPESTPTT